ncbi:hypothetical protein [Microvirga sp. Mcv34]|uniref:hypothetical protein n=1 Tax=Microvirga sp. Mcv34 TaxID=2926016 RepID=UPI0021CA830A|nr:hypothetical protein [Microvirga sp. Mcv34]
MSAPAIKSDFALLDVLGKKASEALLRRIKKNGPVDIVIRGRITGEFGGFDGVSQEFEVQVAHLDLSPSPKS